MFNNSLYGGYMGNAGALAQGNPNFLGGTRTAIPGAIPGPYPVLPGEDPEAIKGVYGPPVQMQPPVNMQPRLPLAQGFGDIGNMGGMQLASAKGFNLFDPRSWFGGAEEAMKKGVRTDTPAGKVIDANQREKQMYDQLRQQGLL